MNKVDLVDDPEMLDLVEMELVTSFHSTTSTVTMLR